jgi:hypothetical protein
MSPLVSDEKSSQVMIYTPTALVRGEVVTKQTVRVSVWLRTEGAPEYIHMLNPQIIAFNTIPPRSLSYAEIYLPIAQVLGFHLTPPAQDSMDYDDTEKNRIWKPVTLLVGTFNFSGNLRVSPQIELGVSIAQSRSVWMSFYHVKISNPYLPQMGEVQVPMLLFRPSQVSFALQAA